MHLNRRILCVAVVGGAVLLAPAAAGAAVTKTVYAGPPPGVGPIAGKILPNPKAFATQYSPDINAFFNQRTTIHVGDKVSFQMHGFHTVDLPASGGTDQPLVVPGALASGFNDAAGSPFWFNGKVPTLPFNPKLFGPSGPHTYDGTTAINSGIPTGPGAPKPLNVKFTRAGTYKFFCDVHYGMVGFVVVKAKNKKIPTASQDVSALTAQVTAAVKSAKRIASNKEPADTVSLGRAGSGGLELFQMFPTTLTVPAGTAVTFTMSSHTREVHTATFGPKAYLKTLSQTYRSPVPSPIGDFPSDPVQPIVLSLTSHGNGFGNVGVLSRDPTTPNPSSRQIKFTQPGTYHFVCLIHPQMQGTIIVK